MNMETVLQTNIGDTEPIRGKVRDIYDLGDKLLIVATDRISAFDVIMTNGIPYKGVVLNQISSFWFDFLKTHCGIEHHMITTDVAEFPEPFRNRPELVGRSMLVKKTEPLSIECIIRAYLTGSGWKDYQKTSMVCGHKLPEDIEQCGKLPRLLFTPSTKAEIGEHDENVDFERCKEIVGVVEARYIRGKSLEIFEKASEHAESKGIILADTKFEWGLLGKKIILIDEVFTPDSSRFWPADKYQAGRDQESFDKQFVRNYLESIGFDKSGPGVELPLSVVRETSDKYIECFKRLTDADFIW